MAHVPDVVARCGYRLGADSPAYMKDLPLRDGKAATDHTLRAWVRKALAKRNMAVGLGEDWQPGDEAPASMDVKGLIEGLGFPLVWSRGLQAVESPTARALEGWTSTHREICMECAEFADSGGVGWVLSDGRALRLRPECYGTALCACIGAGFPLPVWMPRSGSDRQQVVRPTHGVS